MTESASLPEVQPIASRSLRGRLRSGLRLGLWLMVAVMVFGFGLLYLIPLCLPLPEGLQGERERSTVLTDRQGRPLRRFLVSGETVVLHYMTLEEIPQHFVEATVAAEDKRFWKHHGIDYLAVLRAAQDAVRQGYAISGASTITQQLVKITSPPSPRRLSTKIREALMARKLEMRYDKRWILENYINRLPYGNMRTGCCAAAEGYFGKPVGDLTVAESALLAALPNKPTRFNPYRNLDGATRRQQWILNRMYEDGYLTREELLRARTERLQLEGRGSVFLAPHAVELLLATQPEALSPGEVPTSLDLEWQRFVEGVVSEHLNLIALQRETSPFLHAAVVVIENESGEVRVLTGSRSFHDSRAGQINGAWIPRSPGSTLKPFTYLLALEQGIPASSVLADIPAEFGSPTGLFRPVNYDRSYAGPVSLRYALGNSLNVPAVRLLHQLGGPAVLKETLGAVGISTLNEPASHYGLGLTIGGAEVRLLELCNAYACLARLGEWKPWTLLEAEEPEPSQRLFSQGACFILAEMLSDSAARAQSFGWHSALEVEGIQVAAKTGTSSDYRDAWTLGYTPEFTVGVWVGNFDHTPLDHFSGAAGAGPIFQRVMAHLHEERKSSWYVRPEGVQQVEVDPRSGKRDLPVGVSLPTAREWVLSDALPPQAAPADYDAAGRILLPPEYAAWLKSAPAAWRRNAIAKRRVERDEFQVTSPVPGMVIYLDADLPHGGSRLRLQATTEDVIWTSASLQIEGGTAHLVPGIHVLEAVDRESGEEKTVRIVVNTL